MATLDEASHCPKCRQKGELGQANTIPRSRDKLQAVWCRNNRCRWYNTSWVVQVRPDGSVPDPDTRPRVKEYPKNGIVVADTEYLERLLEHQKNGGEISH